MEHDELTRTTLKELFDYDATTGNLVRRVSRGMSKAGEVAGYEARGQTYIRISGKNYPAKNLVWLFHHGEMPARSLIHANGIKTDTRIENLAVPAPPVGAYRSDRLLKDLAENLATLNVVLLQNRIDDKTRLRVMRGFANLSRLSNTDEHAQ